MPGTLRLFLTSIGVLVLIALAGCGDDSDEATGATISRAEFIQRAITLCEARGAEIRKKGAKILASGADRPQKEAGAELAVTVTIPAFERELRELKEIEVPAGDKGKLDAVFDEIKETINRLKKSPGVVPKYPYRHSEQAAAAYGIPACGRP